MAPVEALLSPTLLALHLVIAGAGPVPQTAALASLGDLAHVRRLKNED
jgi:hypothetical protein